MSDHRELGKAGGELERALFSAGRDEWPSERALAKTLAAVGAGVAVAGVAAGASAGASGAKAGASLVSLASVVKWLGVGAVSGVVASGVAYRVSQPSPALPPSAIHPAPDLPRPNVPSLVAESQQLEPGSAAVPDSSLETAVMPRVAPEPKAAPELGVPLAEEVAMVDRGRAALMQGSAARALSELAGYERSFSEPRLLPEVLYLRMEALARSGDAAGARAVAHQIVGRYPSGPHGARAAALLDAQAKPGALEKQ